MLHIITGSMSDDIHAAHRDPAGGFAVQPARSGAPARWASAASTARTSDPA